jgi:hypothetical protein
MEYPMGISATNCTVHYQGKTCRAYLVRCDRPSITMVVRFDKDNRLFPGETVKPIPTHWIEPDETITEVALDNPRIKRLSVSVFTWWQK